MKVVISTVNYHLISWTLSLPI